MPPGLKTIFTFIAIGLCCSLKGYACVCIPAGFMDKYVQSDFVARVTIVKNFPNKGAALYYKSNIVISQLFKGNHVKSILIEGSSDGKRRTSCDIYFKEGTEMLVYARLGRAGQYTFGSCSGYVVLTNSKVSGVARELEMLDFLKRSKIKTTDKTTYGADLHDELKTLNGIKVSKTFAIYEVTFANDLRVDTVQTVTGFNEEVDTRLKSILKEAHWVSSGALINGSIGAVSAGSKLLVGFYYYPAEGNNPSFISEYDL
ncbi:hypothetical protein [Dyadobacter crusticola]|uniref:hypothetical protein n=1 Tax=Dyadobacter crusticola TaxID=292407 RepID=UPI0004E281C8|nr:hypothetical protein [Dyadobacter crusticola]